MTAFKQLRDISNHFEQQLKNASAELFSIKIGEPFEDEIYKKWQDVMFMNSKLRLLKAKTIDSTPAITQQPHSDDTIKEYEEVVMWKVIEQSVVKSLTQGHYVSELIHGSYQPLDPELVERGQKIIQALKEYARLEMQLRTLNSVEMEKVAELEAGRDQWGEELARLRDMQETASQFEECDVTGPFYKKLRSLVRKLELMRWLMSRMLTSRGSRDWLASPAQTARLLVLAHTPNTVLTFVDDS